jgi:pimeloyl-[acyl-carrier protein] synthase
MTSPASTPPLTGLVQDPYSVYRRIQVIPFPLWLRSPGGGNGAWLFSRYDDVAAILKEARVSKDISKLVPVEQVTAVNHAILSKDPPDHTRLRSLVSMAFTPARIQSLEPRIGQIADELIDALRQSGTADFVEEFALPLPVIVIAELLGVPMSDRTMFRALSNQVIMGGDASQPDRDITSGSTQAINAMADYFADLIRERRQHPRADLISDLINVRDAQHKLSETELIGTCILLLIAGHETSANMLGNGMLTLLRFPDQLQLLREHPELLPSAIEEILRYESPLQQATFRVAGETFSMNGVTIENGQQITALLGAANRDPAHFPNPDVFDITRTPNRHLAFGIGIHFCLGAHLARLEGRVGFQHVLEQLPNMQLLSDTPNWSPNSCLRGLASLPIHV